MTSIVMLNIIELSVQLFKYRYKTLDKMYVTVQENTYIYILTLYVCFFVSHAETYTKRYFLIYYITTLYSIPLYSATLLYIELVFVCLHWVFKRLYSGKSM